MTSRERVPTEDYTVGDRMRFYVKAVEKSTSRGPEIILSRSHPNFVRRLFEFEVSEIGDRTVEIVSIAREAGYRTKVAVHSADEKVDPYKLRAAALDLYRGQYCCLAVHQ